MRPTGWLLSTLVASFVAPGVSRAQSASIPSAPVPQAPRDSVGLAPRPGGVPCTVTCPAIPQESPRFFDLRADVLLGAGVASVATGVGTRSVPVVEALFGLTTVGSPWALGGTLRGWFVESQDASGGGGQLLFRVQCLLPIDGLEVHGGVGLGATYLSDDFPYRQAADSRFGPAYEAGLSQEILLGRRLGAVVALDVVGQPTSGPDPRVRSPMLFLGLGLRHHSYGEGTRDPARDPNRARERRRPRRIPRPMP
jgi:hypothetical protein